MAVFLVVLILQSIRLGDHSPPQIFRIFELVRYFVVSQIRMAILVKTKEKENLSKELLSWTRFVSIWNGDHSAKTFERLRRILGPNARKKELFFRL